MRTASATFQRECDRACDRMVQIDRNMFREAQERAAYVSRGVTFLGGPALLVAYAADGKWLGSIQASGIR